MSEPSNIPPDAGITEEQLRGLGFTHLGGNTWTYRWGGKDGRLKLVRQTNGNWVAYFDDESFYYFSRVMTLMEHIAESEYRRGKKDVQDQLHQALGLDRLVEQVVDRVKEDS